MGGTNWLSGASESCGAYLSIRPVTLDGAGGMSFLLGPGSKGLVRPLGPRSAKAVREVAEVVDPPVPEILALHASGDKRAAFLKARDLFQAAPRPERFFLALESFLSNLTQKEAELPGPLRGLPV